MKKKNKFRSFQLALTVGAALMLGGCAMGAASGKKTVAGNAALESGEYQQALQMFQDAILEDEDPVLAYRGLGMACMGLADYAQAEEAFEAALQCTDNRQPENIEDIQLYLATVQYRSGEYEETITTCDQILEKNPSGNADAYFLRGAGFLHEGQQEEADADFKRTVALMPDDYDMYLDIYECYNDNNLSGLGSSYLQSALNIQGDDMEHSYNRGRVYYYLKNYEEAQAQLIGPAENKFEPAMYLIGQVYLAMNDYEHAQVIYQKIAQEFGENAGTCNGLAMCALQSGNYDAALTYIEQGLEFNDRTTEQELYFNEIVAYERKQDFSAAKAKAQQYVERYPSDEAGVREWTFLSTR